MRSIKRIKIEDVRAAGEAFCSDLKEGDRFTRSLVYGWMIANKRLPYNVSKTRARRVIDVLIEHAVDKELAHKHSKGAQGIAAVYVVGKPGEKHKELKPRRGLIDHSADTSESLGLDGPIEETDDEDEDGDEGEDQ